MIKEFLTYAEKVKNLDSKTIETYAMNLQRFVAYATKKNLRWSTLTKQDLDAYIMTMHDENYKPATIRQHIATLRQLLTWATMENRLATNPARYLQAPRMEQTEPQPADREALTHYLNTPATTHDARIAHGLIALLMFTGIRIQEAIDARTEDVDIEKKRILIHGKGRKQRYVYFNAEVVKHLAPIANMRIGYLIPLCEQRTLREIMAKELEGITKTHPHAIRHSFASAMGAKGCDLATIGKTLGHKHLSTTQRYVHTTEEQKAAAYQLTFN